MSLKKLRILPLGGLGEIGMNCMVLEWEDSIVLIDCGLQFPDSSYPGVDLLLPDLSYLHERLDKILGVVVTHGHEDHIGAIPYLARYVALDIYSTPFPRGLLQNKLIEHRGLNEIRFHEVKAGVPFALGPFRFHPIHVLHSIIESMAFAIETPVGNLIHTGDFKHDANEGDEGAIGFSEFEAWGAKGVHLLLSDSTNAERCGHTLSEKDIKQAFKKIFAEQTGRIIVALFASNIRRLEALMALAHQAGKKVALAGRSMHSYTKLAFEQGSLHIPHDTLVSLDQMERYQDDQVIVLATGSQAEPQSALVRVARGTHKEFKLRAGDLVIMSSRFIPGNERNITTMINDLCRQDVDVMYESVHDIHVSGHGFQDELLLMLKATRPTHFVPVHGEFRHLKKHALLAKQAGVKASNVLVIEDGQAIELDDHKMRLAERYDLRKTVISEGSLVEFGPESFAERLALARTGIIFAVLVRDAHNRKLLADPQIAAHGVLFIEGRPAKEILEEAVDRLEDAYEDARENESRSKHSIEEVLRVALRRFFKKYAVQKPIVMVVVLDA